MSRSRRGNGRIAEGNGFDEWGGYMAAKKAKLEQQFQADAESSTSAQKGIFQGISIFVNGHTDPSAEELKRIMMSHGGTFHHYHNPGVTNYIIASNLPDAKIKQLKSSEIYVRPEWITESITAGKVLPYKHYLLVPTTRSQRRLDFKVVEKTPTSSVLLEHKENADVTEKERETIVSVEVDHSDDSSNDEFPMDPDPSTLPEEEAGVTEKTVSNMPQRHLRAGEDNFLTEFYNRSRLHHISTMGSMFKKYVSELRDKSKGEFPGLKELQKLPKSEGSFDPNKENVIMHIDMDCFFVSVGLRNHPELVGQPVAVTHARAESKSAKHPERNRELEFSYYKQKTIGKIKDGSSEHPEFTSAEEDKFFERIVDIDETMSMSEIASCSYAARQKGIKNGMFLGQALKLCPELKTIPYDFEGYQEVARCLYDTVAEYTLQVEAVSCDEMFVDITDVLKKTGFQPLDFTSHLRAAIFEKTKCTASTGLGPNMLLARMATKKAKPDGQFHLLAKDAVGYMAEQSVESLPGVGRSTTYRLHARGIQTCGDLQQMSLASLQKDFGVKTGETLYRHSRGDDPRKLETDHVRKSISVAVNYGIRFTEESEALKFLRELSEEVGKRMVEAKVLGRKITLQIMSRAKDAPIESAKFMGHGVCDAFSKSVNLAFPTADPSVIERETVKLLKQLRLPASDLRGIGIHISRLDAGKSKTSVPGEKSVLDFFSKRPIAQEKKKDERMQIVQDEIIDREVHEVLPHKELEEAGGLNKKDADPSTSRGNIQGPPEVLGGEIDPMFLEALPQELREEILNARGGSNVARSNEKDWRPTSFSQIDLSVLNELPEELQREIRNELMGPRDQVVPRAGPSKSPKKQDKKKPSPTKKGRKKAVPHGAANLKVLFERSSTKEENNNKVLPVPITPEEKRKPNLAGAITLEEVKSFLKEWFETCDEPEVDDINTVTQYFCDLIYHRNLYMLDLLIKFLLRMLKSGKFESWREHVRSIIESVQNVMIEVHGNKLKVEAM